MSLNEPEFNAKVVEMMNQIIREKGLRFEEVRMGISLEMLGEPTKYPDGVIWKNKRSRIASCLFEIKRPNWDPTNIDLVRSTAHKALELGSKYFATWNMRDFILWNTLKEGVPLYDRVEQWYKNIIWVKDIEEVDRKENWEKIKEFLEVFLSDLEQEVFERKRVFVGLPIDEFFIRKLEATVDINTSVFTYPLREKCIEDQEYYKKLSRWINSQGWHPDLKLKAEKTDFSLYEKIARIAVYVLTNKILFYNIVKAQHSELKPIQTERIKRSEDVNSVLKKHFNQVLDINYDTIYKVDIFDDLLVPKNSIEQIVRFLDDFERYDFKGVNYEVLGRVYENLIPEEERHEMGQYFTPPSTVDLINSFCVRDKDDVVLDLGCGAGTFLIRAYARLKYLERKKKHKELLEQLFGIDKASFPSHLAQINLVLPDLSERENFPYIDNKDAFDVKPDQTYIEVPKHKGIKHEFKSISGKKAVRVKIPEMDCVVGNPPYIRQEKIEDKDFIRRTVFEDWGKINISNQADIYVYFFLHGAKFLKDGGRLGFVTSNSWLDVRYGVGLQKFFLDNFKIIAILESKVERSFAKADINTAITIVERCSNKKEREKNIVKFVTLKEKLDKLIPQNGDKERFEACDKLVKKIERVKSLDEDEKMRIFPKSQKELYEEGLEDNVYVGSKWGGKYLRAPDIFFKILTKGKDILVPLKVIADLRRGFTTGANEFFYLNKEQILAHRIEKEFLKPVIKSPRECKGIIVDPKELENKVLMVHKVKKELEGMNVLKYINWGEEKGFHSRPTCVSRERWYDLQYDKTGDLIWSYLHSESSRVFYNKGVLTNNVLYDVLLSSENKKFKKALCAYSNSTLNIFFLQLWGRVNYGEGALSIAVYEVAQIPTLNLSKLSSSVIADLEKAFKIISQREILPILEEVKQGDRIKLDNIVFDILRLTKKERQEVYDAVCELVRNRLEKAKTFGKTGKGKKEEFNASTYAEHILAEVFPLGSDRVKKEFPNDFVDSSWSMIAIKLPQIEESSKLVIEEFFGKASLRIDGKTVDCGTTSKARFVELAIEKGAKDNIGVPSDDKWAIQAVNEYLKYKEEIKKELSDTISLFNLSERKAKAVWVELEKKI